MSNILIRGLSEAAVERIDAEAGGLVRLSTVTRLELGFSARSGHTGREAFGLPPLSLMSIEHLTPATEDRAWEVQMLIADRGQHRAPSIPDLSKPSHCGEASRRWSAWPQA